MEVPDPRPVFIENIDMTGSRVVFKEPLVLLCGGKFHRTPQQPTDSESYLSVRQALYESKKSRDYEFFVAESHPEWIHDGLFTNLINYENNLASICSQIIIILESASAIAEAGVISQSNAISKKTTLIVPDKYFNSSSYIDLGVIRLIEENSRTKTLYYPWSERNIRTIKQDLITDIEEDIEETLLKRAKSEFFSAGNTGHEIILINQLIQIFHALLRNEIKTYLNMLGVVISEGELKKHLTLLENLGSIKREPGGSLTFYACTNAELFDIRFKVKKGRADTVRISEECRQFYETNRNERKRMAAIKKSMGGY